jgi:DNA ligase-1
MGSLLVKNTDGIVFKIGTGFTDEERSSPPAIGDIITYQYIGETKNKVPRFASFLRVRVPVSP